MAEERDGSSSSHFESYQIFWRKVPISAPLQTHRQGRDTDIPGNAVSSLNITLCRDGVSVIFMCEDKEGSQVFHNECKPIALKQG